jgi:ABC-type polysaccharide/polyol phosphate export permease
VGSSRQPIVELFRQRSLLRDLVIRDLRTRYAGSAAGLLWALINPLIQIAILTTVFSLVLKVRFAGQERAPFAVNLAWGLFPWLGVQEGISRATTALCENGTLIKRMAFPPEVVLVQPIISAAIQQVIALSLLVCLTPLLGASDAWTTPLCVLPLAVQLCLTVGIGWILGVLHVYFRDTSHVVVAALQAWFYLTPIVYSIESAPRPLQGLLSFNPLTGIIECFRALALGGTIPWASLGLSLAGAAAALAVGSLAVARARAEIADLV